MGRKPIVSGQHAAALTSMTLRRTWPTATGGLGSVVSGMAISFTSIRWNVAPTDNLPIVRYDAKPGSRTMDLMRWGLVPYWAKDIKIGFSTINAMAETVDTKPVFREAFQRRRCIVPVDNFYEWKKLGPKEKQPYAIALADRSLMALAGLWLGAPVCKPQRTSSKRPLNVGGSPMPSPAGTILQRRRCPP
jgi:putative SOS response-associated peptidase YedK